MKKILVLGSLGLLATGAMAIAQPGPEKTERGAELSRQQMMDRTAQRFARLDLDGDGKVTMEERREARRQQGERRSARLFERMDLDGDGQISRAEFDQVRSQARERLSQRRGDQDRSRADRRGGSGAEALTLEQMQERSLERFDRLDSNRDGIVTADERRSAWSERRQRRNRE